MPSKVQRSFIFGEIAPANWANADTVAYQSGVKKARNVIVLKTGGLQNRAGTEYLGSTKGDGVARLVEATFDDDEGYVLEFGNLYVRPWLDGAPISGLTATAWSASSVAYVQGWLVTHGGNTYVCILDHVSSAGNEPGTGGGAQEWYSLGTTASAVYEYPTTYTTAELPEVTEQAKVTELNTLTVVHTAHAPATLTRIANPTTGAAATEFVWVLETIDFTTPVETPTNVAVTPSGSGGITFAATAVYADGSESTISTPAESGQDAAVTSIFDTFDITWTAVSGATGYNIYRAYNGGYVKENVAVVTGTAFTATGPYPISFTAPPTAQGLFGSAIDYPGIVGTYQQRLLFGGMTGRPDVLEASRTALPYNFTVSDPLVDSDAMSWRQILTGSRLNRVRDIVEFAERLAVLSSAAETLVQGDGVILRPGEVNPRVISQNGSSTIPRALIVGDTALYVSRGGVVRDLVPSQQGVLGSDVSLLAAHLLKGYTIVDWCYQQAPDSVVWLVRDDGELLSCTYVREAGIIAWCHHDTDGLFESVACVSEDGRDVVYAVVQRTIDSQTVRYVERMTDRLASVPVLMDAAVEVVPSSEFFPEGGDDVVSAQASPVGDGFASKFEESTDTGGHGGGPDDIAGVGTDTFRARAYLKQDERTVVSVGVSIDAEAALWDVDLTNGTSSVRTANADLTLDIDVTASTLGFYRVDVTFSLATPTASAVVAAIGVLGVEAGNIIYAGTLGSGFYFTGIYVAADTMPLTGLAHLEGENVSAIDTNGVVLASPYNDTYALAPVTSGVAAVAYSDAATVWVGLPITSDIQTLDIDTAGGTMKPQKFLITNVGAYLEDSMAFFAGPEEPTTATGLTLPSGGEMQPLQVIDSNENTATTPQTGFRSLNFEGRWAESGSVFLRNVDPTPLAVLALVPYGTYPPR